MEKLRRLLAPLAAVVLTSAACTKPSKEIIQITDSLTARAQSILAQSERYPEECIYWAEPKEGSHALPAFVPRIPDAGNVNCEADNAIIKRRNCNVEFAEVADKPLSIKLECADDGTPFGLVVFNEQGDEFSSDLVNMRANRGLIDHAALRDPDVSYYGIRDARHPDAAEELFEVVKAGSAAASVAKKILWAAQMGYGDGTADDFSRTMESMHHVFTEPSEPFQKNDVGFLSNGVIRCKTSQSSHGSREIQCEDAQENDRGFFLRIDTPTLASDMNFEAERYSGEKLSCHPATVSGGQCDHTGFPESTRQKVYAATVNPSSFHRLQLAAAELGSALDALTERAQRSK